MTENSDTSAHQPESHQDPGNIVTRRGQPLNWYRRIGKLGGDKTKRTKDTDYYKRIGKKGGSKKQRKPPGKPRPQT